MLKVLIGLIAAYFLGVYFLFFTPLFEARPIYLLAFPVVSIVAVLLMRSPILLVAAMLFFRALLDTTLASSKLNVFGFNTGLGGLINFLVIFLGILFVTKDKESFRKFPFVKPWTIFLAIFAVSIAYSPARPEAMKLWVSLLTYPVMFYLPYVLINNERDQRYWLNVLLGATIAACAFAYLNLIRVGNLADRISGTFSHPNILAFFVLFAIVLVFYLLKTRNFSERPLAKGGLFLYFTALFVIFLATKTRSAWIACWVFFALYGYLKERKYLFFALIMPPLLFLIPSFQARVLDLFSHTEGNLESGLNSWAWRKLLWENSLAEIKGHFIFGQGLASFMPVTAKSSGELAAGAVGSHNSFLQVIFETGFIGLCAFLAIFHRIIHVILTGAKSIFALPVTRVIALLLVIGYAITCFGDNLLYYLSYNWYFWFFLGLLTRSIQLNEK